MANTYRKRLGPKFMYHLAVGKYRILFEENIKEVKIRGSLGCISQALVEFMIPRNTDPTKSSQ